MAAEDAADRLAFFDTDDFGVTATIGGQSVQGIFDNDYEPIEFGDAVVESSAPLFHCRSADLPTITLGTTTCTVSAVAYVIVEEKTDGTGMTMLRLRDPS